MCNDLKQINEIAIVGKREEKIINHFMPGPITLILKRKESLKDYVTNNRETIAIRMTTSKK